MIIMPHTTEGPVGDGLYITKGIGCYYQNNMGVRYPIQGSVMVLAGHACFYAWNEHVHISMMLPVYSTHHDVW